MSARLLSALLLGLVTGLAHAGPGQVLVVFTIDSDRFKNGLKPQTADTESKLAKTLADILQAKYPPLQFVTTAPADAPAATFAASLRQDDGSIPAIDIHWSAKIGATDLPMPDLHDWSVYESNDPFQPYRSPDKLVSDVKAQLQRWIRSDAIYPHVHDEFVKHVPLATHVDLDEQMQAVLIPLPWLRAQLSDESMFRLEFRRASPPGEMKVVLYRVARRLTDPSQGDTQSLVKSCAASGAPVSDNTLWDSCIRVLKQANPPPYLVSIEHYEFGAHLPDVASNGTVIRP